MLLSSRKPELLEPLDDFVLGNPPLAWRAFLSPHSSVVKTELGSLCRGQPGSRVRKTDAQEPQPPELLSLTSYGQRHHR